MQRSWVMLFREGRADQRDLLGGKGANLAEMTNLGLPVPPGFTITTDACRAYLASAGLPAGFWEEVAEALADVEDRIGRRFGDPADPLLLSVRSGAKFSMPGMMDTVLDLGLNDEIAEGLAAATNPRFAYDAYRRLVQMFGKVVLGIDSDHFERALAEAKRQGGKTFDHELTAEELRALVVRFKAIVTEQGQVFPEQPIDQLRQAVVAVFHSWNTPRAKAYRRSNRISESLGTAVNVQAMVFGNIGSDCCSGVAFTRNPNNGEPELFGELLVNAQGEDVVAGIRTPQPVSAMAGDSVFSPAYRELKQIAEQLEAHYTDMQDVEFTVERGRLWMLQTRTGKRTALAAVRIAIDLANEGVIDRRTAVLRVQPAQLQQLLHPRIDESQSLHTLATGLPASPGAATGIVIFDPMEAKERGEAGEAVILVRTETSADDFPGMERARGILTAHGGMTSHAAVVARGMGKPAVTGCGDIAVDEAHGRFNVNGTVVYRGDELTIDGSTGRVILGRVRTIEPSLTGGIEKLLAWADDFRRLSVRVNADTPADARRAREFGAEGIGLCRTEHMFFGQDRIEAMRAMILADTETDRDVALARLEPLQRGDFVGMFREMAGLPVKIRLLDPPLHEFLPQGADEIAHYAAQAGLSVEHVEEEIARFKEANPMLGLRGCRLGIVYPAITRMQARAILGAAIQVAGEGIAVEPEIMIPLVGDPEELRQQRDLVTATAEQLFAETGARIDYRFGTMIELPRACLLAGELAAYSDFFSFGTNDLTQTTLGLSRDDSALFLPNYVEQGIYADDPFQVLEREGVGQLSVMATERGRAAKPDLTVSICGEHGGEPSSIAFCHDAGLDYVSCSPFRLPLARLAAAHAALGELSRDV
ncbi:MAG: pyruvate, phosphate dikinase [Thermomicrobiales bacterium]|nr:pyruvate, phosphate dikinase [Thermomicrobiales bacterium]